MSNSAKDLHNGPDRLNPQSAIPLTVVRHGSRDATSNHHANESIHGHDHLASHNVHGFSHTGNVHKRREFTRRIPSTPLTIRFANSRWKSGGKFLLLAIVAIGTGAFLSTHVLATPSLRTQVVISSAVYVLGGLALLHLAMHNLFGRFQVDAEGIRLSPGYMGYTIPWSELRNWDSDSLAFRFSKASSKHAHTLDKELLSGDEIAALSELLNDCAPEKRTRRV